MKIPGNVLVPGSWRVAIFVDDRATDEQLNALVDAYGGKLGGPLADLAGLVGEVLDVRRAKISHEIRDGVGTLRIGGRGRLSSSDFVTVCSASDVVGHSCC
ncbi:MAG: DUF1326 domain-containing protein [Actinomycetota bacterium]|nr:DUF1326 domain-containing protein [Actinomycetota bacterium]